MMGGEATYGLRIELANNHHFDIILMKRDAGTITDAEELQRFWDSMFTKARFYRIVKNTVLEYEPPEVDSCVR